MSVDGRGMSGAATHPKRVVLVDDSRTLRSWLCHVLGSDPRLEVVGEASDASEARAIIKATDPDVITLDIEMPGISGLDFLERLMRLRPMPVVMVSFVTKYGSDAAIRALSLGAVDCIPKPTNALDDTGLRDLTRRVFYAACSQVLLTNQTLRAPVTQTPQIGQATGQIVLIGASTGGVAALETLLRGLNPTGPPVVIVQHMPGPFLYSFVQMLNKVLLQDVGFLADGVMLSAGQIRLAPEFGKHSELSYRDGAWYGVIAKDRGPDLYCPSVDTLFYSATSGAEKVTAVLLTGLGKDGACGLKALKDAGAYSIGQDRGSSVVYGMPRVAAEIGALRAQLPLNDIASAVNQATARNHVSSGTR